MTEIITLPTLVIPQLIVGLGNPEPRYDQTRHNIGFAAIDALSRNWHIPVTENRKFQGQFGEGLALGSKKIRILKPLTYMNRSGESIQAVTSWYKLLPESVLVIYDDMDLPLGKIRLRLSGSAGGHNGMKSTISHLNSQNFPRLRIGIGKPKNLPNNSNNDDGSTVSHVLGKFSPQEAKLIDPILAFVVECVELTLKQGVEKAMNRCNSWNGVL
ncbi:aminoacyl-tRNA hydrolase [Cylindrospermopsis raciborskii]|uniref:Peptidyl-tRNA hydrolase n=1 Tax=Cylindrospermopsis raciborskii CENA302 TaxID=1170768 RepID=A0A9Q5QV56_9CYAN|nr:aminoacyl-tRNA hydrolase [Cylindrospermopsis raciborskii]MCZ2202163.1 aminoacyl-tRNA hydrolase [Cylindrospermopsis raciborskii PAMP2012]MCZ2205297.1 aminoacyl-tRNA hydrolase [Cylindrospermopsis raciborskii PAMP2011]NLQ04190.1 aminoacyl-tRNA hydrolase [Cylindrospermopsis raciborskii MVCC19]OHY33803.1 aminoacyl-tRNA hydrolase [Cylindrospermopsis raciborskii MVCC14]OPH08934.1 aminoacyl-tRNA hydrolase [Cylindrospermopsis raciborskii CENA302]